MVLPALLTRCLQSQGRAGAADWALSSEGSMATSSSAQEGASLTSAPVLAAALPSEQDAGPAAITCVTPYNPFGAGPPG